MHNSEKSIRHGNLNVSLNPKEDLLVSESNQNSIFSAEALQARKTKRLSQPALFLRLPTKVTLSLVIASTVGALAWAIFAKVPIKAPGTALVVNVNDIKPLVAKSNGRVLILTNTISKTRRKIDLDLYKFYNQKSGNTYPMQELLATTTLAINDSSPLVYNNLRKIVSNASILKDISESTFKVVRGQAVAVIFNEIARRSLEASFLKAQRDYKNNLLQINRLENRLKNQISLLNQREQISKSYKNLEKIGATSKLKVIESKSSVDQLKGSKSDLESQIVKQHANNKQLANDLASKLSSYISATYVFSSSQGYVTNIARGNNQMATEGDTLLFFSHAPSTTIPSLIVGFIDDRYSNLIRPGMSVVATPLGVNKSQYGGIKGFIQSKLPFSVTNQKLSQIVGLESFGSLSRSSNPNLVTVRLNKNYQGTSYQWTTKLIPESATGVGDTLDLSINVDEQSPLMMAVPVIKRYLGLEGPTTFTK